MSRYAGFKAEVARLQTKLVSHHVQVTSISDVLSPQELDPRDEPSRPPTRGSQPPMTPKLSLDAACPRPQPHTTSVCRSLSSPLPSRRNIFTAVAPTVDGTCSILHSGGYFNPRDIGDFLRDQIAVVRQALGYFSNHDNFLFSTPSRSDIMLMLHQLHDIPTSLTKSQLCQLCAIVSLGAHHSRGSIPDGLEDYAYNVTKIFLDDCIEDSPPTAMQVCALLVARNIVTKATVALTYTEVGLGLSRSLGLVNDQAPATMSAGHWIELKRVRRCLLMMNFWLRMDDRRITCRGVADVTHIMSSCEEPKFRVPTGLNDHRGLFQREMANVAVLKQTMREVLSRKVIVILTTERGLSTLTSGHRRKPYLRLSLRFVSHWTTGTMAFRWMHRSQVSLPLLCFLRPGWSCISFTSCTLEPCCYSFATLYNGIGPHRDRPRFLKISCLTSTMVWWQHAIRYASAAFLRRKQAPPGVPGFSC